MDKVLFSAAQDPADQIISDARKPYMLHALLAMNLRRYGISFLCDDEEGHALAVAVCSLGLRKKKWDSVMPWLRYMTKPEQEAFELRIARFDPTPRNIAMAARFTKADREKYGKAEERVGNKTKRPMQALMQLPLIDGDLETERRKDRNAARRTRRQDADAVARRARVQRHRQCDRAYRQAKRRAEGARPREEYLTLSVEAAKPWEAEGISRRTWWRRQAVGTSPSTPKWHKSVDSALSRKQLRQRHYPVKPDGPQPKISKRCPRTIAMSDLRGETAGLCKVESATTAGPHQAAEPVEGLDHLQDYIDQQREHKAMSIKLDLGKLRQRLTEMLQRAEDGTLTDEQWDNLQSEVRLFRLDLIAAEREMKMDIGAAAFAAFERTFAAKIDRMINPDNSNVLRLRVR